MLRSMAILFARGYKYTTSDTVISEIGPVFSLIYIDWYFYKHGLLVDIVNGSANGKQSR